MNPHSWEPLEIIKEDDPIPLANMLKRKTYLTSQDGNRHKGTWPSQAKEESMCS